MIVCDVDQSAVYTHTQIVGIYTCQLVLVFNDGALSLNGFINCDVNY